MRKCFIALLTVGLVLSCVAGTTFAEESGEKTVLKMGTQAPETSDYATYVQMINERLDELSGGTMSIDLTTGGQLGTIAEHFSQMNQGTLDLMIQGCDAPSVAPGGKDFDILTLPFLFDSSEHWDKFAESDVLQGMIENLQKETKVLWLGMICDSPQRQLTTKKTPVYSPADLKGLQIRTPGSALLTQVWTDFGAVPVSMGMGDLMEALQTGRVDGQDNGLSIIPTGILEYQDYYMEMNHTYQGGAIFMSVATQEKLTDEQNTWLKQAVDETYAAIKAEFWTKTIPAWESDLEETGVTIIPEEEIDIQAFRDIIDSNIGNYEGKFFSEGLYEKIRALAE